LLLGLVVAPALPGADDGPLIDYKSLGGSSGQASGDFRTLSPLVDLKAQLTDRSDIELFRVQAPHPPVLAHRRARPLRRAGLGHREPGPGGRRVPRRRRPPDTVRQRYTITALADRWLPSAYEPLATDLSDARIVTESKTLVASDDVTGLEYRVDSRVPAPPTPQEIAGTLDDRPTPMPDQLTLPADFPDSVRRQAREITQDAATPYDQAVALQQFFTDGSFTYDLRGPGGNGSGSEAIVDFLQSRRGFCEQFAAAYAAMARSLGIPARVAVGFTAGEYDASAKEFSVRARDAHAWPEVYLTGLGWTQFRADARRERAGPGGREPRRARAPRTDHADHPDHDADRQHDADPASTSPQAPRGAANIQTDSSSASGGDSLFDQWVVLTALVVIAAVALLGWALLRVMRKVRRRTRRRRSTVPAHSVAGAWQDALERLSDAGLPPSESLTPHEQADQYATRGAPDAAAEPLAGPRRRLRTRGLVAVRDDRRGRRARVGGRRRGAGGAGRRRDRPREGPPRPQGLIRATAVAVSEAAPGAVASRSTVASLGSLG
jgi:transglutaminase-like putative cysteine protease